jgi:predicted nucleic acid-binding Zn ribbon protein
MCPPFYDYLCESGHETVVEQSIKEPPATECTAKGVDHEGNEVVCHSPCKRLIGNTSFKFKGGNPTPKHYH